MPGFRQLGTIPPLPQEYKEQMRQMIEHAERMGAKAVLIDGQVFPIEQVRFIANLVENNIDEEFYQFEYMGGSWGWSVTRAQQIVQGREPNGVFPLDPQYFNGEADEERIAEADYSIPVIAIPFMGMMLIIDGWQRIHKAYREGKTELPAHHLSEEEEKQIRMPGCRWPE